MKHVLFVFQVVLFLYQLSKYNQWKRLNTDFYFIHKDLTTIQASLLLLSVSAIFTEVYL